MLSVLWRIAFSKYLNDDFSVKRLVYTPRTISNAGEKNLLTSPPVQPLVLLAFFFSIVRRLFSSSPLSPFLSFRYFSLRGARINRPRKCRRSARYTAPAWSVFFVCTREFEERGSSEIRSKTRARKRGSFFEGGSWNKQPSEIDFVEISDDSPVPPINGKEEEEEKKNDSSVLLWKINPYTQRGEGKSSNREARDE